MPQLCEAIVANQTPYVDTVSGATLTSNAVIETAAVSRARMPPRRASHFVPFQRSSGLKPDGLFSSFPP